MTAASDEMAGADEPDAAPPRAGRWRRWAAGALIVLVVAIVAVWIARKPIASHFIDQTLASHHVPARYHIDDLGLGRQRLTDLVIGDPDHPDLVADWVELSTSIGLGGPEVTGVRAGHVRMRGRLIDGHLSLGAIDRLLPPPSGKPFTLPSLKVAVADGRMRLETPGGVIGLKVTGSGKLNDGFSGQLAAVSEHLAVSGCVANRLAANVTIHIADARPSIEGPVRAAEVRCGETRASGVRADIDATLGERLDRWKGEARLALARLVAPTARAEKLAGTVDFEGSPARTSGTVDLKTGTFAVPQLRGAALALNGGYRIERGFVAFQGNASARDAALPPDILAQVAAFDQVGQGTPIGPLADALARAGVAAARSFSINADVSALRSGKAIRVALSRLMLDSASGASATLSGGDGLQYDGAAGIRVDGLLALTGGGLPEAAVRLNQPRAGAPVTGSAIIRPYAAGGARLALTPVSFTATPGGATRFATTVTLSGPLGNGRMDKAQLAVTGLWNGAGRVRINPGCAPLSFDRLAVSGLVLDGARLKVCPSGGALLAIGPEGVSGGARILAPNLSGRLGATPISLAARGADLTLAGRGFTLDGLAVRLGAPDSVTRLDFGTLDGRLNGAVVAGHFAGAGGQIANVPLILSDAKGSWTLKGGVLAVDGDLTVADAAPQPRFEPLVSDNVALKLASGRITASGTLANPATGTTVTDVTIAHDLSQGSGHADLAVPGITFGPALQPDALTRLTYGVIADVKGTVSGDGHIAWSPAGVTSTGVFRTKGADLAAAFGPVTGLSTEIHFTDLLHLVSAPDQVATVAEVNPGIAVENGVVHYQTLSSTEAKVLGARWPFSGGELTLEPTLLDFSEGHAKRLTFRIAGMDAAQFVQKFDFKNINATGTFDGVLPMVFDANGGRIENGHLSVRSGGGTIAYVGELTQKDLGTWGNMAFQALKSLRYDSLDITMNGPLDGEMVTQVRFAGVKQGEGTKTNFLIKRLMHLPFVFNVTIRAPFRQLIHSAESFYDPNLLPKGKVGDLIRAEERDATPPPKPETTIQPPESETVP